MTSLLPPVDGNLVDSDSGRDNLVFALPAPAASGAALYLGGTVVNNSPSDGIGVAFRTSLSDAQAATSGNATVDDVGFGCNGVGSFNADETGTNGPRFDGTIPIPAGTTHIAIYRDCAFWPNWNFSVASLEEPAPAGDFWTDFETAREDGALEKLAGRSFVPGVLPTQYQPASLTCPSAPSPPSPPGTPPPPGPDSGSGTPPPSGTCITVPSGLEAGAPQFVTICYP